MSSTMNVGRRPTAQCAGWVAQGRRPLGPSAELNWDVLFFVLLWNEQEDLSAQVAQVTVAFGPPMVQVEEWDVTSGGVTSPLNAIDAQHTFID
jgi:hypothetical protein